MTLPAFDGSEYRRTVLSRLRERNPSEIEDLFWLAHVPREVDDAAAIAARLRETKGFLNKERSRARQAAVALAVLKQWPRVEGVLGDPAARSALRERLASARGQEMGPGGPGSGRVGRVRRPSAGAAASDPAARRRRQATSSLDELARLRQEPELAEDLFAFLGLPVTATRPMIEERLVRVGEVNRRRRPDRERTLVDELLEHARELLVNGDPQVYLAGSTDSALDSVLDALLAADEEGAQRALARAHTHGIGDAAVLAAAASVAGHAGDALPLSAIGLGIWCPSCTHVNAVGAPVCGGCGAALSIVCTSCRAPAAADLARCPSCGASLEDARAPLLARRIQARAQQSALAQVEAAPEAERQALLARLAGEHPDWDEVRRRVSSMAPRPPARVAVVMTGGEARLSWPRSDEPGVDAYLVERVEGGCTRVLGRTAVTTWSDAQPPAPDTTWTVRALRGESASAPSAPSAVARPAAAPPQRGGALADVKAVAGLPVELSWRAPAGAQVVLVRIERRSEGDIQRRLSVDPAGYRDRQVGRGRRYEYRVSIAGSSEPAAVLELEAGSGATVHATPGVARASEIPSGAIDGVGAVRDADGRLRVTWHWPSGVTEAYVAFDARPPTQPGGQGRKVTNMRYELDNGALLDAVPAGAHVAVFAGRRDAAGILRWDVATERSRMVAP
ncbi:MAG: hypothetical protein QOF69_639 [Solirubrobacteraceae bacterium]|nr:hypothetical protein [Solirubrobacteraceae bacterium]